jgi:hypothetical protein
MPFKSRKAALGQFALLCLLAVGLEQCLGFTVPPRQAANLIRQQRHLQHESRPYIFRLDSRVDTSTTTAEENQISYIIETIGDRPNEKVFREVAEVCINVFFKEQLDAKPEDRVP